MLNMFIDPLAVLFVHSEEFFVETVRRFCGLNQSQLIQQGVTVRLPNCQRMIGYVLAKLFSIVLRHFRNSRAASPLVQAVRGAHDFAV